MAQPSSSYDRNAVPVKPSDRLSVDSPPERVCIVCNFIWAAKFRYGIYIIDLKSENAGRKKIQPLSPYYMLDDTYPDSMAFALYESTLYMFGSFSKSKSEEIEQLPPGGKGVSMWKLSDESALAHISEMHAIKACPRALQIADKICVFSSLISGTGSTIPNFELFDPRTGSSEALPEPPLNTGRSVWVLSYCVDGLNLYISTKFGNFKMDFAQDNKKWDTLLDVSSDILGRPFRFRGGAFVVDDICFTPLSAYIKPFKILDHSYPLPLFFYQHNNAEEIDDDDVEMLQEIDDDERDYEIIFTDSSNIDVMSPVFGDAAIIQLGQSRFCTIKAGFKQVESLDSAFLVLEAFNTSSTTVSTTISTEEDDEQTWDFDLTYSYNVCPVLFEQQASKLKITTVDSFKYVLQGNPCRGVAILGFFLM